MTTLIKETFPEGFLIGLKVVDDPVPLLTTATLGLGTSSDKESGSDPVAGSDRDDDKDDAMAPLVPAWLLDEESKVRGKRPRVLSFIL